MKLKINFKFDEKIKTGDFSAKYFLVSKKILEQQNNNNTSLLRFTHFNNNVMVAGVEEVLQLIKFALPEQDYQKIKIYYLEDGTITNAYDPVLAIEGDYKIFGFLENIIDGILSRRSSVATNAYNFVNLIGSDKIIYMADRTDDYSLQAYDGYSAYIGGIRKFVTNESVSFLKESNINDYQVLGTIPHALIQQHNGDLSQTLKSFTQVYPNSPVIGLIDFHNDCLGEIEKLKENNIEKLDYVRIDTSKKLIDKSLQHIFHLSKDESLYGVNKYLIQKVRDKLDQLGYTQTKIIISSSINLDMIRNYEFEKSPIDLYGVGKSFININVNYTGDLVKLNGQYFSKEGRSKNIDDLLSKMKTIN
ncbi:nicotinate phosphoribosyltransferase [Malacoplasma penetrans]|uniref:nicotinate phosphoribosyltransferase n=1 Tax=Malacoplasma penetrans TaxID=28227 RepID=UPI001011B57B|nr:nicotinate phosphoribosyltransferase [Malacoplasma penetrans]RXY97142.1 nicotinate phosphoribosyltransferase [Malacoplasma penetrans]